MGHKFEAAVSLNSTSPRSSLPVGALQKGKEEGQEAAVMLLDSMDDFLELPCKRNFLLCHVLEPST